jgi:hypothetical protein
MNRCTGLKTEVKYKVLTEGNFKIMGFWEVIWRSLEARVNNVLKEFAASIITLNMEAPSSSEAMLLSHQPTRRHIPEDSKLNSTEVSNISGEHHELNGRKTAVLPHNITYGYS